MDQTRGEDQTRPHQVERASILVRRQQRAD